MSRRSTPLDPAIINAPTFQVRFWKKVDRSGDCWEWRSFRQNGGYGQIEKMIAGKRHIMLAHRVSWMLANGPIPDGMLVLHSCDNPGCVNPGHLRCGTTMDNVADRMTRGRHVVGERCRTKGVNHCASKYGPRERGEAVRLYLEERVNYRQIEEITRINRQTVSRWVKDHLGLR